MANKKCNYCRQTMNRVVWGMPTIEEMENPKPMTEYAGCIVGPETPKWHCENCGSQVIPGFTPQSGHCLKEAPILLKEALERLIEKVLSFSGNWDAEEDEPPIFLDCPESNKGYWLEEEEDNHRSHGDSIYITICGCQSLRVFLDGSAVLSTRKVVWGDLGAEGDYEQTTSLRVESMVNLQNKMADLIFGNSVFRDLIRIIGEQAAGGCQKDLYCEDEPRIWQILCDYAWAREGLFPEYWNPRLWESRYPR